VPPWQEPSGWRDNRRTSCEQLANNPEEESADPPERPTVAKATVIDRNLFFPWNPRHDSGEQRFQRLVHTLMTMIL